MPAESPAPGRAAEDARSFRDIYPFYLEHLAPHFNHDADAMANFKLQQRDAGLAHGQANRPEDKRTQENKRKRANSSPEPGQSEDKGDGEQVEALMSKHLSSKRRAVPSTVAQTQAIVDLIRTDFPMVPANHVGELVAEHDYSLFSAYLDLDRIISTWHEHPLKSWNLQFAPQDVPHPEPGLPINEAALEVYTLPLDDATKALLREINEARTICRSRRPYNKARSASPTQDTKPAIETEIKDDMQLKDGEWLECECCFEEVAIVSVVHCNGEDIHFVCIGCARRNAETQIGLSRHTLHCLSSDQCEGGFDESQRRLFLDENLTKALDRIEWSNSLQAAGIEGLATCPFCEYAAEYPPVEEAPVFRCEAPSCLQRSCRKCNKKDHEPNGCEAEYTDADLAARRKIEEARTKALIRKCNKCRTPFIKDMGCNRMCCTKCRNQQCYLCGASVNDYSHFGNGSSQCILWDENIQSRHDDAVEAAERTARARVLAQSKGSISEDKLKINMAKAVQEDDERRRIRTQRGAQPFGHGPYPWWVHVENPAAQAQPIQPAWPADAVHGRVPAVAGAGNPNGPLHQMNALGWAGLHPPAAFDHANRRPRFGDIFDGLDVGNPWQQRHQRLQLRQQQGQQQQPHQRPQAPAPAPVRAQLNMGHRPPRQQQQHVPRDQQQPVQDEFLQYQQLVLAQRQLQQLRDQNRHQERRQEQQWPLARPLFLPAPALRLQTEQERDEARRALGQQQRQRAPAAEEQQPPALQQPQRPNRQAPQAQDARFRNHLHGMARAVEGRFRGARGFFARGQRQLGVEQRRAANVQADVGGALEDGVRQALAANRAAGQNPFAVRAPERAPESGNKRLGPKKDPKRTK